MNLSDLRDASDSAADRASTSLRRVSDMSLPDVSVPDVSLPDALDIDVAALAGSAIEFAGDVAGVVVTEGGRGINRAIVYSRRNPKVAIGIVAMVVLVVGLLAAKKRSSDPSLDKIS
jgi:hypothetical protein